MRAVVIVILAPSRDQVSGMAQVGKQVFVVIDTWSFVMIDTISIVLDACQLDANTLA